MHTYTLTPGNIYRDAREPYVTILMCELCAPHEHIGWTDGEDGDGGHVLATWFDNEDRYLGPDCDGTEPLFATPVPSWAKHI